MGSPCVSPGDSASSCTVSGGVPSLSDWGAAGSLGRGREVGALLQAATVMHNTTIPHIAIDRLIGDSFLMELHGRMRPSCEHSRCVGPLLRPYPPATVRQSYRCNVLRGA